MRWILAHGVQEHLTFVPKFPVDQIGRKFRNYTDFIALTHDPGPLTEPVMMYDIEAGKTWPTPLAQQQAPVRYMQLFCQLAHSIERQAMVTPGLDLANATPGGNTFPDDATWYLKTRMPWHAARDADRLQVQTQSLIPSGPAAFYSLMEQAGRQAAHANPYCTVGAGLSTHRGDVTANVQCFAYTVGRLPVRVWWMNVPGPNPDYVSASSIMAQCEQIAVQLGL